MILSPDKASIFADEFIDYFSNTGRIDEYLVKVKLDRLSKLPSALPGMGPEEDLFTKFDMHPSDMKIKVKPVQGKALNDMYSSRLQITMSHVFEDSIPGKSMKWMVFEENTDKIIGFISSVLPP